MAAASLLRDVDGLPVEIERSGARGRFRILEPRNRTFLRLHIACADMEVPFDLATRSWTADGPTVRDILSRARVAQLTPRKIITTAIGRLLLSPTKTREVRIQILDRRAGEAEADLALYGVGARTRPGDDGNRVFYASPEAVTTIMRLPRSHVAVAEPTAHVDVQCDGKTVRVMLSDSGRPHRDWYRAHRLLGVVTIGDRILEMYDLDPSQGDWIALWPTRPIDHAILTQRLPYGRHIDRFAGYLVYRDELGFLSGSTSASL